MARSKEKSVKSSTPKPRKRNQIGWGIDQTKYDEARRQK